VDIEAVACVHNLQYRFSTGAITSSDYSTHQTVSPSTERYNVLQTGV